MSLMDNSDPWAVDTDKYEYARKMQKYRAANHWAQMNWNMWKTFNTELNSTWVDPWYENEFSGISNDPPASLTDRNGYQMLQNIYGVYCWLKYKGYCSYAITAMLTAFTRESFVTGGAWEAGYHPYKTIVVNGETPVFDPTKQTPYNSGHGNYDAETWFVRAGTIVPAFTRYATDPNGIQHSLTAPAGSWTALMKPNIKWDYNPSTNQYSPVWNYDSITGYAKAGGGYGLVQWTPWTKLPRIIVQMSDLQNINADRHWQLSLTMQLMVIEKQRELSAVPPVGPYLGEWVSTNAAHGAFVKYGPNIVRYGSAMSWNYFRLGSWYAECNQKIAQLEAQVQAADPSIVFDEDEIEWHRREFAITVWDACYEKGGDYYTLNNDFRERSLYIYKAIEYWDSCLTGPDDKSYIMDIPRPRDIPYGLFELDCYHIPLALLARKRKVKPVERTLLL